MLAIHVLGHFEVVQLLQALVPQVHHVDGHAQQHNHGSLRVRAKEEGQGFELMDVQAERMLVQSSQGEREVDTRTEPDHEAWVPMCGWKHACAQLFAMVRTLA